MTDSIENTTEGAETRLMPISEAAEALEISRRTLQRRMKDGSIKGHKKGNRWLVEIPAPLLVEKTTVDDLTEQLAQLTQERNELAQKCDILASDKENLLGQREALRKDVAQLTEQVDGLTRDLDEMQRRVSELVDDKSYLQQALAAALSTQRLLAERATATRPGRSWWKFWEREESPQSEETDR